MTIEVAQTSEYVTPFLPRPYQILGITPQAARRYETKLAGVLRWGGKKYKDGQGKERQETLLDHVNATIGMIEDISRLEPFASDRLGQMTGLTLDEAVLIAYLHDAGEIRTTDIPRLHPNYEKLKHKKAKQEERYALGAFFGLLGGLPFASRWERVQALFNPSERVHVKKVRRKAADAIQRDATVHGASKEAIKQSSDNAALLVVVLDRLQAVEMGLDYMHTDTKHGEAVKRDEAIRQMKGAFVASAPHLEQLLINLEAKNPKAKEAMAEYIGSFQAKCDAFDPAIFQPLLVKLSLER